MNNETPTEEIIPNKNEEIDKLTIELLLNKNHYSKYLKHTDTKKYDDLKLFKSKLKKFSIDIIDITSTLIENPKQIINKDIEESFESYTKSIIRYLEVKSVELKNDINQDEDMLFENMEENMEENRVDDANPTKSYWSNEQVIKSKKMFVADKLFTTRK